MKEQSYGIVPYTIKYNSIFILMNTTSSTSFYNFFKGKTEGDEKPDATSIREFYEEAGILVNTKHLEEYFYQNNDKKFIGVYLLDFTNYLNQNFKFDEREIFGADWLNIKYHFDVSRNQKKIYNEILLYLRPRLNNIKHLKGV